MDRETIVRELSPFCDIGEGMPKVSEKAGRITVKMVRDGRPLSIYIDSISGKVQTTSGSSVTKYHASFGAMLASEVFANLKRWADAQRDLLNKEANAPSKLIAVNGDLHDGRHVSDIDEIDKLLAKNADHTDATAILLIDGPAGIGKTNLIEQLALRRAETYRGSAEPLILHVKSRGRVLSNLQDLMAFSLQTLRLSITYDQVPILVKNGLVVLAIDGFDELGDPNGYELAWSQVNNLVSVIRGRGHLILAGRDTFIGRARLFRDVKSLRAEIDEVTELKLDVPSSEQAKTWLKSNKGWSDAHFSLPALSVLFEEGSYALRPVVLRLLGDHVKPKQLHEKRQNYLTTFLVESMIQRETTKFGDVVESALTRERLAAFVRSFLYEVARDMADSQSESIDDTALLWIAEAALGDGYPPEIVSLIKNRANVIDFLTKDERQNHRTFVHTYLQNYFLSNVAIDSISNGDIPKFVRRNILGTEFLLIFSDVAIERSGSVSDDSFDRFISEASAYPRKSSHADRGIRNIGALLIASLSAATDKNAFVIQGFNIDDAIVRGTAVETSIKDVVVNQLDVRGADLSALTFDSATIVQLLADDGSRFPTTFPLPTLLTEGNGCQIGHLSEIEKWINARGRKIDSGISAGMVISIMGKSSLYRLLGKACRLRQHWLRSEGDVHADRIISDPDWPVLSELLDKHGFLRKEVDRQASGKSSVFFHIRQPDKLLSDDMNDELLARFYRDLVAAAQHAA